MCVGKAWALQRAREGLLNIRILSKSADLFDLIVVSSECLQSGVGEETPMTGLGEIAGQAAVIGGHQAATVQRTGGNGGGMMTAAAGMGKPAAHAGIRRTGV